MQRSQLHAAWRAPQRSVLHVQHVAEDSFVRRMFGVRAGLAHDARPDMLSVGRGDEAALRLRLRARL